MSVNDQRSKRIDEDNESELFSVLEGSDDRSSTFVFGNEDHTLGNSLRHVLMLREEVDFCGYSVPHPYEPKMNVRLQVKDGYKAKEVLALGLKDLEDLTSKMEDEFARACAAHRKNKEG